MTPSSTTTVDLVSLAHADAGTAPRSAHDVLEWSRQTVTPHLQSTVATLPTASSRVVGYQFGWSDARERTSTLRSALTLLAAEAVGGSADDALAAATAVELAHQHCQLHDDVAHEITTRRNRATAWTVYGTEATLEAANELPGLAFGALTGNVRAVRMLNTALLTVVDAQLDDLEEDDMPDLTECARRSTDAALMAAACSLGALFGGGSRAQVEHLRAFGGHVGLVYQHVEDLIGIWGEPGYPDLSRRRWTLPVVAALTSGTAEGQELAELYQEPMSDAERAADLVDAAGGRTWCLGEVDSLLVRALHRLRSAQPAGRPADELFALARQAARHDH